MVMMTFETHHLERRLELTTRSLHKARTQFNQASKSSTWFIGFPMLFSSAHVS